jgi:hypothetical protein
VSDNHHEPALTSVLVERAGGSGAPLLTPAGTSRERKIEGELERLQVAAAARERDDAGLALEADPDGSRIVSMADLRGRPEPRFLVDGLVPEVGVGLLSGPTGVLKSFLSIGMGLSVASSAASWFGFAIAPGEHSVLYVAMEGGFDFVKRVDAWIDDNPGSSDERFNAVIERALDLSSSASLDRLAGEIETSGFRPALLIVDTFGLAIGGSEESSNSEMNILMGRCKRLTQRLGCFVLLVHHTGYNETRPRGASALVQAADLAILVERDRSFTVQKVRAGPSGMTRHFEAHEVRGSLAVRYVSSPTALLAKMASSDLRVRDLITTYVSKHPGCTATEVRAMGGARGTTITDTIKEMVADPLVS